MDGWEKRGQDSQPTSPDRTETGSSLDWLQTWHVGSGGTDHPLTCDWATWLKLVYWSGYWSTHGCSMFMPLTRGWSNSSQSAVYMKHLRFNPANGYRQVFWGDFNRSHIYTDLTASGSLWAPEVETGWRPTSPCRDRHQIKVKNIKVQNDQQNISHVTSITLSHLWAVQGKWDDKRMRQNLDTHRERHIWKHKHTFATSICTLTAKALDRAFPGCARVAPSFFYCMYHSCISLFWFLQLP